MRKILLIVVLLCSSAWAAIPAFVQGTGNGANTVNTIVKAFSSNLTAGNSIIVMADVNNASDVLTVSDTQGLTFTAVAGSPVTSGVLKTYMWVANGATAAADTVTVNSTGTHNLLLAIGEFSNGATLDQVASSATSGTTTLTTSSTTIADEIVWFGFVNGSGSITTPTGYTLGNAAMNQSGFLGLFYKIVSSTGAQSGTTTGASDIATNQMATFGTGGAATKTCTLSTMGAGPC